MATAELVDRVEKWYYDPWSGRFVKKEIIKIAKAEEITDLWWPDP
jgi:hypothetical protein